MPALPYLAAALAGALVGWLVCAMLLRRRDHEQPPGPHDEARLAASVLDRVPTGYLVLDRNGHLRLANPPTEVLGLAHLGLPEPTVLDMAAAARTTGEPQQAELPGRRPGVESVQVTAVDIGDGLVLVAGTDMSAVRRAEAVRRDFVANVSHELKTPVTAIGLLAEAVLGGADDPELVRSFGARLQRESGRLATMVTELIALSAVQGTGQLVCPAPVGVDDVVADAIDRASVAARTAAIALTTDDSSGLSVAGDRGLLTTAVTNLVENAVAYSPAGSAVSVSRVDRGDRVEIAITDRGIGIAPEHQQRVFERFFRVDPARSRATGGTGLGLAIVKHVAAIHGGSVSLWSRVGVGSTFTLSLPPAPAEMPEGALPDGALPAGGLPAGGKVGDPLSPQDIGVEQTGVS